MKHLKFKKTTNEDRKSWIPEGGLIWALVWDNPVIRVGAILHQEPLMSHYHPLSSRADDITKKVKVKILYFDGQWNIGTQTSSLIGLPHLRIILLGTRLKILSAYHLSR